MKKILFIEWKSFGNTYITQAFEATGYQMERFVLDQKNTDTRRDEESAKELTMAIMGKGYTFVFSFNYYPIVAIACKACNTLYVSWTYDSPFVQLFSKTAEFDTNLILSFDSATCRQLEQKGIPAQYLPMAAPMDCYASVLANQAEGTRYRGDIAFVGSLYDEISGNLLNYLDRLKPYEKGFVDALIKVQKNIYGCNFVEDVLNTNPEVVKNIQNKVPVYARGDGLETAEWVLANYFINRKITVYERQEILELLAKEHAVKLYTTSTTEIVGVENCGNVDYHRQAPHVFANSKINLNISLRSILSGVPLRAFDIMACGGFLLSNYQEDYMNLFTPDEDFVVYYDYGDLKEKADFYLRNDTARQRIAANGQQKVARYHTYLQRVQAITEMVETIYA